MSNFLGPAERPFTRGTFHVLGMLALTYMTDLSLAVLNVPIYVPKISAAVFVWLYLAALLAFVSAGFIAARWWFAFATIQLGIAAYILKQTFIPSRL